LSLLMDALRRAETNANEAPQDTAPDPLSEVAERPASNSPLQLEPLDAPAAKQSPETAGETSSAAFKNADADAQEAAPETQEAAPETAVQQAQSVLQAFAVRKRSARKHLIFTLSGLASAAVILAGYYFWRSYTTPAYQVAPAATLIDSTAPVIDQTVEATQPATDVSLESAPVSIPRDTTPAATATDPVANHESVDTPAAIQESSTAAMQDYRIEIRRTHQTSRVPDALQQAYEAYRQGEYTQADEKYRQVLKTYPANRDAMLGLAAIALHKGQRRVARYYYERLVKADPADKVALLALQGLSGTQYSLESGSKLKYWLEGDRDNAQLHFALGNQYAASGQWKEAQQSYFEAYRIQPDSADYAFNLAVSLDNLGLRGQALTYYLQAQELAEKGAALFSAAQLDRRITDLHSSGEPGK